METGFWFLLLLGKLFNHKQMKIPKGTSKNPESCGSRNARSVAGTDLPAACKGGIGNFSRCPWFLASCISSQIIPSFAPKNSSSFWIKNPLISHLCLKWIHKEALVLGMFFSCCLQEIISLRAELRPLFVWMVTMLLIVCGSFIFGLSLCPDNMSSCLHQPL